MRNTIASRGQLRLDLYDLAGNSARQVRPARMSEAGADIALLVCALFLQRFTLTFGNSLMSLDVVPAAFILVYQFVSGRVLIQYDRLLWFLALWLAVTCSLILNFRSTMLPSYCLLIVIYSVFTLSRPSTTDRYKSTLLAFQFLVAIVSFLAVAQFVAQFVVDGREVVRFYGIVPEFLFTDRFNTIIPVNEGSSLIKSNGLFLLEPSTLSQMTGLGILIEIVEFRRLRYLLLFALGLLLSYSGTGLMFLLGFLPVACIGNRRAQLPVLFVIIFALGLVASGTIDVSAFLSRVNEFEDTQGSAFQRFVSPFWLAKEHFDTAPLQVLLLGSGPGTTDAFAIHSWYAGFAGTWIKLLYEYGLMGSLIFILFLANCFRGSECSRLVLSAILFIYVFLGGYVLNVEFLIIMTVLCTLSRLERPRGHIDSANRRRSFLLANSAAA